MDQKRILFICVHNSARSQMAEAFANHDHGDVFIAESAGLEPGVINPLAVAAMADAGIDIADNPTSGVFDRVQAGELFDYVVTVCTDSEGECPIFPGIAKRIRMPFDDPSKLQGTDRERLAEAIRIRDEIRQAIADLAADIRNGNQ